jgi:drug/metabolite transporter (DMT)-like permease
MDTNTSSPATHNTPVATVYGWLLITAGALTVLVALGEKMRVALIVGAVMTVIGIVLVMIGNKQKKNAPEQNGAK